MNAKEIPRHRAMMPRGVGVAGVAPAARSDGNSRRRTRRVPAFPAADTGRIFVRQVGPKRRVPFCGSVEPLPAGLPSLAGQLLP